MTGAEGKATTQDGELFGYATDIGSHAIPHSWCPTLRPDPDVSSSCAGRDAVTLGRIGGNVRWLGNEREGVGPPANR
jgi:hypothetical protein